jgi:putative endonuclease
MNTKEKGRRGEQTAETYLVEHGYTIIERNFRTKAGEIDIIAETEDSIVFIEVKGWSAYSFENMEYAIHREKRKRIIATSRSFLYRYPKYNRYNKRYDLLYVNSGNLTIKHVKNVFTESGQVW